MSAGVTVKVGNLIPLHCQLESQDTAKFVRGFLVDVDGNAESGSPFTLPHIGNGLYADNIGAMPDKHLFCTYVIYNDAGFTEVSTVNLPAVDAFSPVEANINRVITDLTGEVETTNNVVGEVDQGGNVVGEIDDPTVDGTAHASGLAEGQVAGNENLEGETNE